MFSGGKNISGGSTGKYIQNDKTVQITNYGSVFIRS